MVPPVPAGGGGNRPSYHLREIIVHLLVSERQDGTPCRNEVTQRSGASEVLGTQ